MDEMERVRATRTLIEAQRAKREEMAFEAFMGIFHPEMQKDRKLMRELKADMKLGR